MAQDLVQQAYNYFVSVGYAPHQAAALAGNMRAESSGNPTIKGDEGKAFGSYQWHPDRQVKLAEFSARTGKDMNAPETQWAFKDWELKNTEKRAGDQLRNATDVRTANDAVLADLRPQGYSSGDPTGSSAYDARLRYSAELLGQKPGDYVSPRDAPVAAAAAAPEGLLGSSGWTPAKNDALIAAGKALLTKGQGGQPAMQSAQAPEEFRPQMAVPGLVNPFRKRSAGLLGGTQ